MFRSQLEKRDWLWVHTEVLFAIFDVLAGTDVVIVLFALLLLPEEDTAAPPNPLIFSPRQLAHCPHSLNLNTQPVTRIVDYPSNTQKSKNVQNVTLSWKRTAALSNDPLLFR